MNKCDINPRYGELLKVSLGPDLTRYLEAGEVIEIMVNPDGRVVIESLTQGKRLTRHQINADHAANVIRLVASCQDQTVDASHPEVAGVVPGNGARFQGWLPPVVARPAFCIRKHHKQHLKLGDYTRAGLMTASQAEVLRRALAARRNIIISGGTSSGKTTLAAAVLRELEDSDERIFILEDLPELRLDFSDQVVLRTSDTVSMHDLVRGCLRMRPDRIIIGEVRDGAALDLLKAWNTGHPGGLCTLHANSAEAVVTRLHDLVAEAVPVVPRGLILQAVNLIVQLDNSKQTRGRVVRIARLDPLADDRYQLVEAAG